MRRRGAKGVGGGAWQLPAKDAGRQEAWPSLIGYQRSPARLLHRINKAHTGGQSGYRP